MGWWKVGCTTIHLTNIFLPITSTLSWSEPFLCASSSHTVSIKSNISTYRNLSDNPCNKNLSIPTGCYKCKTSTVRRSCTSIFNSQHFSAIIRNSWATGTSDCNCAIAAIIIYTNAITSFYKCRVAIQHFPKCHCRRKFFSGCFSCLGCFLCLINSLIFGCISCFLSGIGPIENHTGTKSNIAGSIPFNITSC